MRHRWLAAAALALAVVVAPSRVRAADAPTLYRLFLKDGTTLVSYGAYARVGDRVVFSMPTTAGPEPPLVLVNLAADRVDWDRTARYGTVARAAQYVATRAESDYTTLTNEVARTLNQVATTQDPAERVAIVEGARKKLAEWPAAHFNYRYDDVRQMLVMLDDAIAGLRTAAGRFDLNLVAYGDAPPVTDNLLPPPTPKEAIEQTLAAARLVDTAVERESLLSAAVAAIDGAKSTLPADWAAGTRGAVSAQIAQEIAADGAYAALGQELTSDAAARARMADVPGVQRIADSVAARDAALGRRRPDVVSTILAAIDAELDAARRLRLARDHWALRAPVVRRYRLEMRDPLNLLASLQPALENIKALAGSSPATLASIHHRVAEILNETHGIAPPEELRTAHALFVSAVQLAGQAAQLRREAVAAGDMVRAWDASSAAAGALMLGAQARTQIQSTFRRPELP